MTATPRNTILTGDAATRLAELEDASIDCVITSPPYFRLRDYQNAGQLGLEATVDAWVHGLRPVLRQLARVLVPTGTVWLNLGDTYSTHPRQGAPAKSLLLGPERLALALIEDGWTVRNKIIWAKTNPIPSSVPDRLSTTHEVIYLLTRHRRYFFDLDAIRQPAKTAPSRPPRQPRRPGQGGAGVPKQWRGPNTDSDTGLIAMKRQGLTSHPLGKNPGDVWPMATSRYRGQHFATYPEQLVERMLLAGVPEQRCSVCRAPRTRPLRRLGATALRLALRPTCDCHGGTEAGIVLDPFIGSGTTGVVAKQHHRDWLGIELHPDFADWAEQRIADTPTNNRKEEP
ncbi:site-specific DNA-methyltransferase [Tessaracoccus aquimaris]|uniref:Methyltransferase n=1 Tax=Tessaracoccus aquimaris TaxID=1332264 RepID=A0A1Q2CME8_9ACTN|nr:site-specific DNA-methyltransferase [Tessaracoccus aquimaris]AQP47282.1 site-specific DNA-methyltransferase [Tessaracoccus aquimaris]